MVCSACRLICVGGRPVFYFELGTISCLDYEKPSPSNMYSPAYRLRLIDSLLLSRAQKCLGSVALIWLWSYSFWRDPTTLSSIFARLRVISCFSVIAPISIFNSNKFDWSAFLKSAQDSKASNSGYAYISSTSFGTYIISWSADDNSLELHWELSDIWFLSFKYLR